MKNIIIVDDDPVNNFLCERMIKHRAPEYSIASFTDPVVAISKIAENPIDVETIILLDINMPIMDGWEFLEKFMTMNLECKIYILTSSISPNDLGKSLKYPIVRSLFNKPFSVQHIQQIVAEGND